jgi:hypothetical protein
LSGIKDVQVNALQYTQAGDNDEITIMAPNKKEYKVRKQFITVKF